MHYSKKFRSVVAMMIAGLLIVASSVNLPLNDVDITNSSMHRYRPTIHYSDPPWQVPTYPDRAIFLQKLTSPDASSCHDYGVCSTDLGISFKMPDSEIGYLFGDTFATPTPDAPDADKHWRSPVLLTTSAVPSKGEPMKPYSAAGPSVPGMAAEIVPNSHIANGEYTVIPNDGLTLPDGRILVSYMSVKNWHPSNHAGWTTNYAGLATSNDGGRTFDRNSGPNWPNNADNTGPFQMQSMQMGEDGYVYLYGVSAGRQQGPMLLMRVPWLKTLDQASYECWNGTGFGGDCQPLIVDRIAEPSVRLLHENGHDVWVMAYLNTDIGAIGTRYATSPTGPWSDFKVQVTDRDLPYLYGGFIDPRSSPSRLVMSVSSWPRNEHGNTTHYNVDLFEGTT